MPTASQIEKYENMIRKVTLEVTQSREIKCIEKYILTMPKVVNDPAAALEWIRGHAEPNPRWHDAARDVKGRLVDIAAMANAALAAYHQKQGPAPEMMDYLRKVLAEFLKPEARP